MYILLFINVAIIHLFQSVRQCSLYAAARAFWHCADRGARPTSSGHRLRFRRSRRNSHRGCDRHQGTHTHYKVYFWPPTNYRVHILSYSHHQLLDLLVPRFTNHQTISDCLPVRRAPSRGDDQAPEAGNVARAGRGRALRQAG